MANLTFDFNTVPKKFLNVKLKDGRTLQVKMPKKRTFSNIQKLQDFEGREDVAIDDVMDTFAQIVADTLSNNLNDETVTAEYLSENYDIGELREFIGSYYNKFVSQLAENPN